MSATRLTLNATASAELVVSKEHLASACAQGATDNFPAVFSTPRLVELMEVACARVMQPILATGELSAGVAMEVRHLAPTPEGARVTATARYTGREGDLYVFEVTAQDPGGEIGRARHTRAIVAAERLLRAANRRAQITR